MTERENEEVEGGAGWVIGGPRSPYSFFQVCPAHGNPPGGPAERGQAIALGLGNRKHFGEPA